MKIRSCEDTIYFTPEDLGYKYNTYYYNLKELSPGMVIHKNEAYPPIEIVDISRNRIKAKFKGDIYEEEIKVGQDEPLFKVTLNKPIPKIKLCPICGSAPKLEVRDMGRPGGHGYPGCDDYTMSCPHCNLPKHVGSDTILSTLSPARYPAILVAFLCSSLK